MSIDFPITHNRCIETEPQPAAQMNVAESYDGTNVVFRALRLATWGPTLLNLGYYPFAGGLSFLNVMSNMELAQQRLVRKSIELLQVSPEDRVLDVACGRGKSSFMVQALHPRTTVIGIDLLDRNVQVARTLFDQVGGLSYRVGNAMDLDFQDASFDRVMCLEAAFHFPDRQRFLREAARVLRPGGRLVVVDFAWNSDAERIHRDDPETRIVREIWQWSDFSSIPEYERIGRAAGFRLISSHDWSQQVTRPIQTLFEQLSALGGTSWGRRVLAWINPLYRSFSIEDWDQLAHAVRGHEHVRCLSKYMAFVFEKR
ncbi:MAG: Phthiotriol/phenolphthiotriol dimycocerosates methyltransferase [Planctomycetaceae bacterium]|nr:Phthiotriol/phenolphthiotriol dimycocerosates methyltransferase [Planctomycetaceae bacterium]